MIRAVAYYLPQYYPIPENNKWWGEGFTEWTNVTKAKPLFKGHYQPILPSALGFYDLRVPEIREAQAELAKNYGLSGFCYWHYWFGNGKRILERVFDEVLKSGKPDFPFCLGWANESWTGIWYGNPKHTLVTQTYPGKQDYHDHFDLLAEAFHDKRYIKVDGKPFFLVYRPNDIPDLNLFVEVFQERAIKEGFPGIHLVGSNVNSDWDVEGKGFDAITLSNFTKVEYTKSANSLINYYRSRVTRPRASKIYKKIFKRPPHIYEYKEAMKYFINDDIRHERYYPMVIPNWDNTARSGLNGYVLKNSSPNFFGEVLVKACEKITNYHDEHKIIIIKSWNEWAEGNYLEPDTKFGYEYLQTLKDVLLKY